MPADECLWKLKPCAELSKPKALSRQKVPLCQWCLVHRLIKAQYVGDTGPTLKGPTGKTQMWKW